MYIKLTYNSNITNKRSSIKVFELKCTMDNQKIKKSVVKIRQKFIRDNVDRVKEEMT